jgi:hypothetical protein
MSMLTSMLRCLLPLSCLLLTQPALADSMRCGNRLVASGDHPGEVLAKCGAPFYEERKTIYRSGTPRYQPNWADSYRWRHDNPAGGQELSFHNRSVVEVPVDVWVYNFGRSAFMKEVTFVDGKLTTIRSLGYGE